MKRVSRKTVKASVVLLASAIFLSSSIRSENSKKIFNLFLKGQNIETAYAIDENNSLYIARRIARILKENYTNSSYFNLKDTLRLKLVVINEGSSEEYKRDVLSEIEAIIKNGMDTDSEGQKSALTLCLSARRVASVSILNYVLGICQDRNYDTLRMSGNANALIDEILNLRDEICERIRISINSSPEELFPIWVRVFASDENRSVDLSKKATVLRAVLSSITRNISEDGQPPIIVTNTSGYEFAKKSLANNFSNNSRYEIFPGASRIFDFIPSMPKETRESSREIKKNEPKKEEAADVGVKSTKVTKPLGSKDVVRVLRKGCNNKNRRGNFAEAPVTSYESASNFLELAVSSAAISLFSLLGALKNKKKRK